MGVQGRWVKPALLCLGGTVEEVVAPKDTVLVEWYGERWPRFHAVLTPIGSTVVTFFLSRSKDVGWVWNSQAELEVAANFASGGILFYTASFVALEAGVWIIMVLALQALKKYEADKLQARKKLRQDESPKVAAMFREAQRLSEETREAAETIFDRLYSQDWQPTES